MEPTLLVTNAVLWSDNVDPHAFSIASQLLSCKATLDPYKRRDVSIILSPREILTAPL